MSEQDPSTSIEIKVGMEDKPMDKPMNPMQWDIAKKLLSSY
jgi:hypothetical protein